MSISYTDELAEPGSDYCYYVTQINSEIESEASNQACAYSSFPPDLPAPENLSGYSSGFEVFLIWDAPPSLMDR